jgi:predicted phage terminase large subunit-like protein
MSIAILASPDFCPLVSEYDPLESDKVMRLYSVRSMIDNGFVFLPDQAQWRAEYLHEIASFPNGPT